MHVGQSGRQYTRPVQQDLPHSSGVVDAGDVEGTEALFRLLRFKFYRLAVAKVVTLAPADVAVVDEYVIAAAFGRNEAVSFFAAKPLYCSAFHNRCFIL